MTKGNLLSIALAFVLVASVTAATMAVTGQLPGSDGPSAAVSQYVDCRELVRSNRQDERTKARAHRRGERRIRNRRTRRRVRRVNRAEERRLRRRHRRNEARCHRGELG